MHPGTTCDAPTTGRAVGAILFASTHFPWRFTSVKPISLAVALHFGFGNGDNVFAPFFKNLPTPDPVLSPYWFSRITGSEISL